MKPARRAFVIIWIALGVLGALNHTVFGRSLDLVLPHLKYGYVMFNDNPREVPVFEYAGADGVRHNLADLVATPAPTYKRARVAIDLILKPDYLREICYRTWRATGQPLTFFVESYKVDEDPTRPAKTEAYRCGPQGLEEPQAPR